MRNAECGLRNEARRASRKGNFVYIVPLDPAYEEGPDLIKKRRGLRGTFRPNLFGKISLLVRLQSEIRNSKSRIEREGVET